MSLRIFSALILGLALLPVVSAQDALPPPPGTQNPGTSSGTGFGQRGGMGQMGGMMGQGVTGTVTEIAADHYTIKTQNGEAYTIHYSANTRLMKQPAGTGNGQGNRQGAGEGAGQETWRNQRNSQQDAGQSNGPGRGMMTSGGGPPQQIKSTNIKVGDSIAAMGEVDSAAKSVGAVGILQLDPERAKQLQQMQENFGKTWLMGKVTAINEVQVTLQGSLDSAPHTFLADENTTFRERRNPITLADIHVGDTVRVDGALKEGAFTATVVTLMAPPADTPRAPRNAAPPQ